ncbi:hypothetical protein PAXRUDRAFT_822577 [Paxillus rubicundulus Ve08.2h10]|uniref:Unplaced genomic scaffold scaffold_33, whole genome shotgun sequence n=1 Tax=Paxillus rubicundulus Ve08.2h10 TaxID=930991 RepID=A0A0D0ECL6_9AGAM|nr:hypothetical protein PAXRUDRAFT_822577 [Paxillus rubicundulus Ve08.2h10]
MFKRVERKRKKCEEEEDLGLDEDMKAIMGLHDTDSDESDSDPESEGHSEDSSPDGVNADSGREVGMVGRERDDEVSSEEGIDDEPPMSVAEALKNPIYLISLDPTVHGCILCRGKLIKSAGMAAVHKNAIAHKRRFERFKALAVDADQGSNAWDIVKVVQSVPKARRPEPSEILSNRALKRQIKQVAIREKRRRHKDLKVKAIAKKAFKKPLKGDEVDGAPVPSTPVDLLPLQSRSEKSRKKRKTEQETFIDTAVEIPEVTPKPAVTTSAKALSAKRSTVESPKHPHPKGTKKVNRHHNKTHTGIQVRLMVPLNDT